MKSTLKNLYGLFLTGLLLIGVSPILSQQNNSLIIRPGEIWPDNTGNHINAHGGGVLFHENKYYWFGEHKGEKTSAALVGVNCYSSVDLVNWTFEGVALSVSEEVGHDIEKGCVMERPKVIYNKKTGKFVMWFHLELKGKGYSAARAALAVSDSPAGPYQYIRSGRVNPGVFPINMSEEERDISWDFDEYKKWWTPEWHAAVKKGLFVYRDLKGGQMSRDMTLFVDDDDKAYHIYSSEENLTMNIAELADDYQSHSGKYITMYPGGHNEAPAIFKKDGTYWMITSGCTGWDPNEARMFSSSSIWGPWTQHPNPCVGEKAELTFGGQSTFILPVQGRSDLFIFMADIWRPKNPIDARYIWLPIDFDRDGKPVLNWRNEWDLASMQFRNIYKTNVILDSIRLSDPAILADSKTNMYYMTGSGGMMWKSKDLKFWDGPFNVVEHDKKSWMGERPMIWAAELHEYNGRYYYFATFTNREIIVDTVNGRPLERRASHVLVGDKPDGPYVPMKDETYIPADMLTLDGTFWVDSDGKPYMIYCHEWLQNNNGTMEKIELKPDLSGSTGKAKILFRASDSPWSREKLDDKEGPNRVTDGPYLFRTQTGRLGMIWTSWVYSDYTQGVAYSESGKIDGPWIQEKEPITPPNFGHGMLFKTLEGKWLMSVHSHKSVNGRTIRVPHLFEIDLSKDKLIIGDRYNP